MFILAAAPERPRFELHSPLLPLRVIYRALPVQNAHWILMTALILLAMIGAGFNTMFVTAVSQVSGIRATGRAIHVEKPVAGPIICCPSAFARQVGGTSRVVYRDQWSSRSRDALAVARTEALSRHRSPAS
jgi:hypothetical protein